MSKQYFVYIITNKRNGILYTGVTNDLIRRIYEHKNKLIDGFTSKYDLNRLIYYEETVDIYSAIKREKQLKRWKRIWKLKLIEDFNPKWLDLSDQL